MQLIQLFWRNAFFGIAFAVFSFFFLSLFLPTCIFANLLHIGQHSMAMEGNPVPHFPLSTRFPSRFRPERRWAYPWVDPPGQPTPKPWCPSGDFDVRYNTRELNKPLCTSNIPLLFHPRPLCDCRHIIPSLVDSVTTTFLQNLLIFIHAPVPFL